MHFIISMVKTSFQDIKIRSPVGVFEIPSKDVYDLVRNCARDIENNINLRHKNIFEFFEEVKPENEFHAVRENTVAVYLKCMKEAIERDYNIIKIRDYDSKGDYEIPPTYHEFEVGPKMKESLLLKGQYFIEDKKTKVKYVISVIPYHDSTGPSVELEIFYLGGVSTFRNFWDKVEKYFDEEGPLLKSVFDCNWKFIECEDKNWESIVITEEMKSLLERNVVNFLDNIKEYKTRGLPTSRGILMTGPPGTGKTLCCETLIGMTDCSVIYVTSDTIDSVGQIKKVYEIAQRISPTMVIIEDIDTLGGLDRRERGTHPLLGEFLNCLNSVGGNEGVITIATTNYPQHLDAALADRPGRFDLRLEFNLPDKNLRKHILNKYLSEIKTQKKMNLDRIIPATEGLSGAYLREIIITSYMISLEKKTDVNQEILGDALKSVLTLKDSVKKSYGYQVETEEMYG